MMRNVIVLAFAMVAAAGCSVKEDRSECPCRLVLDFSRVDTTVVRYMNVLAVLDGEVVIDDCVDAAETGVEYVMDVPHGSLLVNVWSDGMRGIENGRGVVIPYGCECPPIYMHSFVADTKGEICRVPVDLCKNHCRLTVTMDGVDEIPYSLTFKGNVNGYDMAGQPSAGDFSYVAYPVLSGDVGAVLPRQVDSSLLMEVDDGTSTPKTFALGEYIASSGYDWTAKDLEDVTIVLDYYITYIKISVQGWDKEYVYNITL